MSATRLRGQVFVLVVLGLVGLLAFTALAVDGSRVYMTRRDAQNAADAAALAMAWEWIQTRGNCAQAVDKGLATARRLGYDDADPQVTVEAYCPPQDGDFAGEKGYFQVRIHTATPTTFLQVVRFAQVRSTVEAISRASLGTLFGDAAIVALSEHNQGGIDGGIKLNGNSVVTIRNGGMFSNSDDADKSIWAIGTADIYLDPGFKLRSVGGCTVGDAYLGLCAPGAPQVDFETWVQQIDDLIPSYPPPPACTDTLRQDVRNTTLGPGVYCITNDILFDDVTFQGKVVLVATDNDIEMDGTIRADNLEVYLFDSRPTNTVRPELRLRAGIDFYAQRWRVYGDGDVQVLGNTVVRSDDTFMYLTYGVLDWNGNASMKLCGAAKDDPDGYGGLVVYMKTYEGNPDVLVNGNTDNWFAGTFLAPYTRIQFNGNTDNTFDEVSCHGMTSTLGYPSQIIGYAVKFNGNTHSFINFDPRFLFSTTMIELVK